MFSNIGWTEMMVIAVVAIIFVGPKDLPGMLRQFGRFSRKVRGMAGDFQKQVDDALREAELDSVRDSINDVRNLDPRKAIKDRLNPLKADIERDPNAHPEADDAREATPTFDDDAAPAVAEPVKVDVDAALERQAKLDAAAIEAEPAKDAARKPTGKPAARTSAARTSAGKKPVAKKPATKVADKSGAKSGAKPRARPQAKPRAKAAKKAEA